MVLECSLKDIIIIDTESTGLLNSGRKEKILQLGCIDGNGHVLIDQKYKPDRITDWSEAEKINGICYGDVALLQTFTENKKFGCKKLYEIVKSSKCLVFYNANFDKLILENSGFVWPDCELLIIDAMHEFSKVYKGDKKFQKLETAASYYGFKIKQHSTRYGYYKSKQDSNRWHNAVSDCLATLHVFKSLYKEGCLTNIIQLNDFNSIIPNTRSSITLNAKDDIKSEDKDIINKKVEKNIKDINKLKKEVKELSDLVYQKDRKLKYLDMEVEELKNRIYELEKLLNI